MFNRVLTSVAVLMGSGAFLSPALAQNYPPPPGYSQPVQPYGEQGRYTTPGTGQPNFDLLDDDDAPQGQGAASVPPPGPPPQAGYQSQGGYYSQQGQQQAVPQGPILSPDDPRYGRPPGPPPVIYSDRNPASNPGYESPRPPAGVDGRTGSVQTGPDGKPVVLSALPPDEQPETGPRKQLPERLRRQEVNFPTKEPPGTIIVDTPNTQLYYVLGGGRAIRYGVRVGRDGFTWTGVQKITRKAEWPDWHPPAEMIERQPYLPRFMAGGDGNPLGARAMYLGNTVYRIHGTNQPSTIGKFVSSGCIGMLNEDVTDLFDRVKVGTRVVVLPGGPPPGALTASAQPAPGAATGYGPGSGASAPTGVATSQVGVPNQGPTVVPPLPAPVTVR
ncbi:MAG: L,D-transpeptidase [Bradyrhizobiaceae bacterium]|nr:MAG: L,D-transpeptidase [Bradyrhizobiaceae bacterium]